MIYACLSLNCLAAPQVRLKTQSRSFNAGGGHVETAGVKSHNKDKAFWWASRLGEQKVHVVAAALNLIGDSHMQSLYDKAALLYATDKAASLGGAFMKVMKDVDIGGTSLYENAKQISGERKLERLRQRHCGRAQRTNKR
jgi:hypothetical protein